VAPFVTKIRSPALACGEGLGIQKMKQSAKPNYSSSQNSDYLD
jgi:hypothetical protein